MSLDTWTNLTKWIVMPIDGIMKWYLENQIFDEDPFIDEPEESILTYETMVANYVSYHAHKFTGHQPRFIWHDLDLWDPRLDKHKHESRNSDAWPNPDSSVRPDIILQFDSEVWMVEVKYRPQSPDMERRPFYITVKAIVDQVNICAQRLQNLVDIGWFPGCTKIIPAVFCAFYYERSRVRRHLDSDYAKWPADIGV